MKDEFESSYQKPLMSKPGMNHQVNSASQIMLKSKNRKKGVRNIPLHPNRGAENMRDSTISLDGKPVLPDNLSWTEKVREGAQSVPLGKGYGKGKVVGGGPFVAAGSQKSHAVVSGSNSKAAGKQRPKSFTAPSETMCLFHVIKSKKGKPVKFKPKSKDNDVEVTDLVGPCGKSLEGIPWGSRLERNTEQLSAVVGGEALAEGKKDNGMQRPYERERVEKPLMGAWAARQAKREQKMRLEESGEGEKPALKETDSAGNEHKTENQEERTVEHISCESGMKEEKNVEAHAERQDLALVGPEASDKPVKFKPKSKDNDVEVTDLVGPCGKSLEGTPWGSRLERNTEQLSAVVGGEALAEGKKDNGMQRPYERERVEKPRKAFDGSMGSSSSEA